MKNPDMKAILAKYNTKLAKFAFVYITIRHRVATLLLGTTAISHTTALPSRTRQAVWGGLRSVMLLPPILLAGLLPTFIRLWGVGPGRGPRPLPGMGAPPAWDCWAVVLPGILPRILPDLRLHPRPPTPLLHHSP